MVIPDFSPLFVRDVDLNKGLIWDDGLVEPSFPVTNGTDKPVTIDRFSVPCSECVSINPHQLELQTGETKSVFLKARIQAAALGNAQSAIRPFAIDIVPVIAGQRSNSIVWRVHGHVKSRVTLKSEHLHFGDISTASPHETRRRVQGRIHVPADNVVAEVIPPVAHARVIRSETSSDFFVDVSLNQELIDGQFAAKLRISVFDNSNAKSFGCEIPIEGRLQTTFQPCPQLVLFGLLPIGQKHRQIVCFGNAPNDSMKFVRSTSTFKDVTAIPLSIPLVDRLANTFVVEWNSRQVGNWTAEIGWIFATTSGEIVERRVPCSGRGTLPKIPWSLIR